ncbi:hypothetical protein [Brevibacillus laterosporus]|uniref:hypothetical protein n=1 Tax=Brevibacillus laterosporus TaxID=1465 RepID=UPI002656F1C9|nr:hypothetical protein [Brevibacillus laterosporus]MDN9011190.1 hypothetical protein [Brevibacillus laterosporus]MDO0942213.1 hypothetical protein [Brevibacillus laterosporus]
MSRALLCKAFMAAVLTIPLASSVQAAPVEPVKQVKQQDLSYIGWFKFEKITSIVGLENYLKFTVRPGQTVRIVLNQTNHSSTEPRVQYRFYEINAEVTPDKIFEIYGNGSHQRSISLQPGTYSIAAELHPLDPSWNPVDISGSIYFE